MKVKAAVFIALVMLFSLCTGKALADVFPDPHSFYGTLTINGSAAPIGTEVKVTGDNVLTGIEGNPLVTTEAGAYGGAGAFDVKLIAQGNIASNTVLTFYVNGVSTGTTANYVVAGNSRVNLAPTGMAVISSQKDSDSNGVPDTACENYSSGATEHIAYVVGSGFTASHSYKFAYYDGSNTKRATETQSSNGSGALNGQHTFTSGTDIAGTWHTVVYDGGVGVAPPSTWDTLTMAAWGNTLASDTFTVQDSAIPEFPTVFATIAAVALCVVGYLWMRRKVSLAPI